MSVIEWLLRRDNDGAEVIGQVSIEPCNAAIFGVV